MRKPATCYMCDAPSTSREHAPPSCFFPDANVFGRDVRRNLVTVPSCDAHNSQKSKDDEFLRATILLQAAQSSDAARHQFFAKLLPAAERKPHAHGAFLTDQGTVAAGAQRAARIDRTRFDGCVDHLARALFFDAFRQKWTQPIAVTSPNFYSGIASDQMVPHAPTMAAVEGTRRILIASPIRGQNPEVFWYQLRFDEAEQSFAQAGPGADTPGSGRSFVQDQSSSAVRASNRSPVAMSRMGVTSRPLVGRVTQGHVTTDPRLCASCSGSFL